MTDLFDRPIDFMPSGQYLAAPVAMYTYYLPLTNPYFRSNSPVKPDQTVNGPELLKLEELCRNEPDYYIVDRNKVMDYSHNLLQAARTIKENEYDLVLCPLRGGRLPGVQSQVICDDSNLFFPFDSTDLSRGHRDEQIKAILSERVLANHSSSRRIGILDHAKGGDGCASLARILSEMNQKTSETWDVGFHLIHPEGSTVSRANNAYKYCSDSLTYNINKYQVEDLLVEDEDKLLGYGVESKGGISSSYRLESGGRILYRDGNEGTLLHPAQLDHTLFGLVSNEVGYCLSKAPDVTLVDPDYWKRFETYE